MIKSWSKPLETNYVETRISTGATTTRKRTFYTFGTISYSNGKDRYNDCDHEEIRADLTAGSATYYYNGVADVVGTGFYPTQAFVVWPAYAYPVGFRGRSYQSLKPDFRSETNIMNFIYEATDISRIFTSLLASLKLISSGKLVSAAAESNLNYSFGMRPLWSDILNLSSAYSKFRQSYFKILDDQNKVFVHHYKEEVPYPATSYRLRYQGSSYDYECSDFTGVFVNTVKYKYRVLLSPPPPNLGTFLKWQGFRPSQKAVWDAIPFSFMIDWVIGIGSYLQSFEDDIVPVRVTVIDCTVSSKVSQKALIRFNGKGGTGYPAHQWDSTFNIGTVHRKRYKREKYYPGDITSESISPRFDGVSIRELMLSLSLLIRRPRT